MISRTFRFSSSLKSCARNGIHLKKVLPCESAFEIREIERPPYAYAFESSASDWNMSLSERPHRNGSFMARAAFSEYARWIDSLDAVGVNKRLFRMEAFLSENFSMRIFHRADYCSKSLLDARSCALRVISIASSSCHSISNEIESAFGSDFLDWRDTSPQFAENTGILCMASPLRFLIFILSESGFGEWTHDATDSMKTRMQFRKTATQDRIPFLLQMFFD